MSFVADVTENRQSSLVITLNDFDNYFLYFKNIFIENNILNLLFNVILKLNLPT